ncbi:MAG: 3-keto-disaccharide hydrolase [Bacteroidota bacterium]
MKKQNILLPLAIMACGMVQAQNRNINMDSLVKLSKKTEVWEPVPVKVSPGKTSSDAPSDAIILFNGKGMNAFQKKGGGTPGWKIDKDGSLTVVKMSGDVETKQGFGSCQLHIEWKSPALIAGSGQSRGNSGIFFMGKYELQVLDSYENPTYVNGQAASIYKQHIPLVNASRKPGEWQSYDVIFTAPQFYGDGTIQTPARITVFHNGVLVQNNVEIKGGTEWIGAPGYKKHKDKEPLILQDHGNDGGNPMSYRNIWIREL